MKLLSMQLKFIMLLFLFFPTKSIAEQIIAPVSGRVLNESSILPADVLARAKLLMSELQLIRKELGKPDTRSQSTEVINAAPREVYFQALALFNKSNRLSFEQTGFSQKRPLLVDSSAIRPFHVWQMADHALQRVLAVKAALNITEHSQEIVQNTDTRPSDVFAAMLDANRVINSLLNRRFSPSDVYQQVTVSVYTMAQLLSTFDDVIRIPEEPTFERLKKPDDVYKKLLACYQILTEIAEISGYQFLQFSNSNASLKNKEPSDVYDLSALLVADISYLHAFREGAKQSAKAYYPGFKIPSHVYQRAGILHQQLEILLDAVQNEPDWLIR